MGIYGYMFDPSVKNKINNKVVNLKDDSLRVVEVPDNDSLLNDCKNDFNYYSDIAKKKYDVGISILETKKVTDLEAVEEFYKLWGTGTDFTFIKFRDHYLDYPEDVEFPLVLYAAKFKGNGGKYPTTIVCDSKGKIMEKSQYVLLNTGQWLVIG